MNTPLRHTFGSRLGLVLATAGSAVGLGNIWRFPYELGSNGGAVFLLVYVVCIVLLGLPTMLCEMVLGRRAQANATRAYGRGPWRYVGYLAVLTAFLIMGFYAVVAGWTLQYTYASLVGQLQGDPEYIGRYFEAFTHDSFIPVAWTAGFVLLTHLTIVGGVQKGIERMSKWLMPLLFLLLVVLVGCSLALPGSKVGLDFLFRPDWSKLSARTVFDALGQTFFSLSIAMGCLITYASYFSRKVRLDRVAVQTAGIDTMVAVMAGLIIFPAAFSVGIKPDAGPSLIFITLPNVFEQAFALVPWLGNVVGALFYVLLAVAALTSLISLHEAPTAFVIEEFGISRRSAARWVSVLTIVSGTLCSLSLGPVDALSVGGRSLFDFLDYLTADYLLIIGGLLMVIYVGWVMPKESLREEMTNFGAHRFRAFGWFRFCVRFICPIGIVLVFLHQLGII